MSLWWPPFSCCLPCCFRGWSGHLADRASKRTVLIGVKIFELFIMLIGLAALVSDSLPACCWWSS